MTETLERAITIHQPYAWAVAAGHKPVENRTWRPPLEAVGKPIGIHASKAPEDLASPVRKMFPDQVVYPGNMLGALIGVARLVGVARRIPEERRESFDPEFYLTMGRAGAIHVPMQKSLADRIRPWWRGPWGWLLEEAVLLPEPIPMRGQQGLWRIPEMVREPAGWRRIGVDGDGQGAAAQWALEQWRKARETR